MSERYSVPVENTDATLSDVPKCTAEHDPISIPVEVESEPQKLLDTKELPESIEIAQGDVDQVPSVEDPDIDDLDEDQIEEELERNGNDLPLLRKIGLNIGRSIVVGGAVIGILTPFPLGIFVVPIGTAIAVLSVGPKRAVRDTGLLLKKVGNGFERFILGNLFLMFGDKGYDSGIKAISALKGVSNAVSAYVYKEIVYELTRGIWLGPKGWLNQYLSEPGKKKKQKTA